MTTRTKKNPRAIMSVCGARKKERRIIRKIALAGAILAMAAPQGYLAAASMMTSDVGNRSASVSVASGRPSQLAVLTAIIVTNTTASTKTAYCGSYSFHAKDSLLGVGVTVEHSVTWEIFLSPVGFVYKTEDFRSGANTGSIVNLVTGGWTGWTFAFPMTHAGTYQIRCTIKDREGNSHAVTTSVTVAAFAGDTVYLDGGATGTNDGTSSSDAYDNWNDARADILGRSDARLMVAGGQGYTQTVNDAENALRSNLCIEWDGTGGTKPVFDLQTNIFFRFTSFPTDGLLRAENVTINGCIFKTSTVDTFEGNGVVVGMTKSAILDLCVLDCGTSSTGDRLKSFVEYDPQGTDRYLLFNNNNPDEISRYALCFGNVAQFDIVGNTTGNTAVERSVRIRGTSSIGTIIYNNMRSSWKEHIALQFSDYATIDSNAFERYSDGTTGSSNAVHVHYNNGYCTRTTISNNEFNISSTESDSMAAVKSATSSAVISGMDIMLRGNVIHNPNSTNSQYPFFLDDCDRLFVLNNTIEGASSSVGLMEAAATTDAVIEGNIWIYSGPGYSAFNDNLWNITVPVTGSIKDNDIHVGSANTHQSKHYKVNGTEYTESGLNGLTYASGNSEETITLDSDHMPSPLNASTNPYGILEDFYGNAMTPGVSGFRGAVQSVPTSPPTSGVKVHKVTVGLSIGL